jgi:hypothetical protein
MRAFVIATALALSAAPAVAVPTVQPAAPSAEAVDQEMAAYGAWMGRVLAAYQPIQDRMNGLRGAWASAARGGAGAAQFRAHLTELERTIDEVDVMLRNLPRPAFSALGLAPDLMPDAIIRDMQRINAETRVVVRNFGPLLDSLNGNDPARMEAATNDLMRSTAILLESQILLARGSLASVDRDEVAWEANSIMIVFLRAMHRSLSAWPQAFRRVPDATLADDYERMAREVDSLASDGSAKNEAEVARLTELATERREAGDTAQLAVLNRALAVYRVTPRYFALGRDIATTLRNSATVARRRPFTIFVLQAAITDLPALRLRFDEIMRDEHAAMAAGN